MVIDNIIHAKLILPIMLKTSIAIHVLFHFDWLGLELLLAALKPTNKTKYTQQLCHGLHETAN